MIKVKPLIYLVLVFIMVISCSDQSSNSHDLLLKAQDLLYKDPKRAFSLLDSIVSPKEMGEELYMQYIVSYVEAKRQNNLSIAGDTLIFQAQQYYDNKGDFKQATLANFYAGSVCDQAKAWDQAISYFHKAIMHAFRVEDNLVIGKSYHTLGSIFQDNNLLDSAMVNFNKALEYYNKMPDTEIYKMKVLNNLGIICNINYKYSDAESYFRQALKIAEQINNLEYQGHGNQNLGWISLDRKEYNNALEFYRNALPNLRNTGDSVKIYLSLSKLYSETHKLDSASYYTSIVKKILPQIKDNRTLAYTYKILKDYYQKEGDYKEALHYSTLFDSVFSVINNQDLIRQLHKAETKREIAVLYEKEKAKHDVLIAWMIGSYVVLMLLVVTCFIYFRMRSKMIRQEIEQEVEKKKKEKELAEARDSFFQFNAGIHYKIMNQWKDICTKIVEVEDEMAEAMRQQTLPRMGKTLDLIHRKTSYRLISLGKEFLKSEPNGEKALRFMKDQEILCMMLVYHKYPFRVVELMLDKPISQKEFQGILRIVEIKLRQASFSKERIDEILFPGTEKMHKLI